MSLNELQNVSRRAFSFWTNELCQRVQERGRGERALFVR